MNVYPSGSGLTDDSMALYVTRHALIAKQGLEWNYLSSGIDSLDVGFYVNWGATWNTLRLHFDEQKQKAQGTNGILIETPDIRKHIFLPSGKAPNYRYHFQFPEYHIFIAISDTAKGSPNVYVSLNSEAISQHGIDGGVSLVVKDIESFGGKIILIKPSRIDLCVDYKIPGGLSESYLRSHCVSRARELRSIIKNGILETLYVGARGAPIMARFYDKGKEIANKGNEGRWLSQWGIDDSTDVWRVEFQLRRTVLKQFGIDTIDDLKEKLMPIWNYLTGEWISLRYPDNDDTSRCTVHEFWMDVQGHAQSFGPNGEAFREYGITSEKSLEWHISRLAVTVLTCAVILGDKDLRQVFLRLQGDVSLYWSKKNFADEWEKKSIAMGIQQKQNSMQDMPTETLQDDNEESDEIVKKYDKVYHYTRERDRW